MGEKIRKVTFSLELQIQPGEEPSDVSRYIRETLTDSDFDAVKVEVTDVEEIDDE